MHGPKQAKAVSRGSQSRSQCPASVQGLQTTEPEGGPWYDSATEGWDKCRRMNDNEVVCKTNPGRGIPCRIQGEKPFET
jgi:hypothetical protein